MGSHIVDGEFQSDKYPTCPRGKVPLSVRDPAAQDLLWEYAQRRRSVDAEFSGDLEIALRRHGHDPTLRGSRRIGNRRLTDLEIRILEYVVVIDAQGEPLKDFECDESREDAQAALASLKDKIAGASDELPRRPVGTYIASRASLPERSAAWRGLRDADGWRITSSWIDEADPGQSADLGDLWLRIDAEIAQSERLVLYVEPEDFPLKGALIEVGMALAREVPIRVVSPGVILDPVSFRPLGSWIRHPLVTFADTMDQALSGAIRIAV